MAAVTLYGNRIAIHFHIDGAERSRHGAFHPFESAESRFDGIFLKAGLRGLHAEIIFAEQIYRACSPCVAETLAVWTAIHRQFLGSVFVRVVFLPE